MAVTAAGARRRITALHALGYSPAALAAETGLRERVFTQPPYRLAAISQDVLDRVGDAYDALWNRPAPESGEAQQWRDRARAAGWAPPMAYDDDLIDTPDGRAARGWQRDRGGHQERRTAESIAEDVTWLREVAGYENATTRQVAERLAMTPDSLNRALERSRSRALERAREAERTGTAPEFRERELEAG